MYIQWSWVQISLTITFYGYFNESFSSEYHMYHLFRYAHVITSRKFQLKWTWWLTKAIAEMKPDTEQTMKSEWLYKVRSECELNSWPGSSVGSTIWTEFSGRGFKSHSGQLYMATSTNPSVVNTICSIHSNTLMWLPQ